MTTVLYTTSISIHVAVARNLCSRVRDIWTVVTSCTLDLGRSNGRFSHLETCSYFLVPYVTRENLAFLRNNRATRRQVCVSPARACPRERRYGTTDIQEQRARGKSSPTRSRRCVFHLLRLKKKKKKKNPFWMDMNPLGTRTK